MLVDDETVNLKLLTRILETNGYTNLTAIQDPREVVDQYRQSRPDLILLDINMPFLDGYQVLDQLKKLEDPLMPPVVVLTAQRGQEFMLKALKMGARDYLTKPFDMGELLLRVQNMLDVHRAHRHLYRQKEILNATVKARTDELLQTRLEVVQRLGRASEYRDNETGKHILRVSHTAVLIARELGWSGDHCETLLHATPMHDIGKIGIPDHILLKPGRLNPEEWEMMKKHTIIGAHILEGSDSDLIRLGREIALTHHERWNGTGYPKGLTGEEIPLSGRIVALADVFDALLSRRTYKSKWSTDSALEYIRSNKGIHFDPLLVDIFEKQLAEILSLRNRFVEPEGTEDD